MGLTEAESRLLNLIRHFTFTVYLYGAAVMLSMLLR